MILPRPHAWLRRPPACDQSTNPSTRLRWRGAGWRHRQAELGRRRRRAKNHWALAMALRIFVNYQEASNALCLQYVWRRRLTSKAKNPHACAHTCLGYMHVCLQTQRAPWGNTMSTGCVQPRRNNSGTSGIREANAAHALEKIRGKTHPGVIVCELAPGDECPLLSDADRGGLCRQPVVQAQRHHLGQGLVTAHCRIEATSHVTRPQRSAEPA